MIRARLTALLSCLILAASLAGANSAQAAPSAVGRERGRPILLVDGKPATSGFVEIYYYPGRGNPMPGQPEYGDPRWVEAMKRAVDTALAQGVRLVMASVWWSDIDRSPARPSAPQAARYDFAPLDAVMDYAVKRKAQVVLKTSANHFLPDWWLAEQGFPPGAGYQERSACRSCETDAYGTAYANPSMGSPEARRDFGAFLEALVGRYRTHPALVGWAFGLGPTGEDGYGPNYIVVDAPGGGPGLGRRPMMFTDYSPDFTARFRSWLTARYGTDAGLRQAWGDPKVSLADFRVPPPAELVREPALFSRRPFPDAANDRDGDPARWLTPKGMDFYAFRNWARDDETDYFARLFKTLDKKHVLFLNARARASARAHPDIDGIFFNPNPRFGQPLFFENDQLDLILRSVEQIVAAGKLAWAASENGHEPGRAPGAGESKEQINYLLAIGCGVKSLGGVMGYAVDLLDPDTANAWLPTWRTSHALSAIKAIEAWKPAPGRGPCETITELRRRNGCDAGAGAPAGCRLTELALINYCRTDLACDADRDGRVSEEEYAACRPGGQTPPPGAPGPAAGPAGPSGATPPASSPGLAGGPPGGPAGKCGDGVCDDFERSRGVCPADCGASSSSATPAGVAPPASNPGPAGSPPAGAAGKCGDGLCDDFERSRGVCPADCGASAPAGPAGTTPPVSSPGPVGGPPAGAAGKCGDGVCDDFERSHGVCPADCSQSSGASSSPAAPASSGIKPASPALRVSSGAPGAPAGGPGGAPQGAAGKCGDGVCDDFERSRGVCPADCASPSGASAGGS